MPHNNEPPKRSDRGANRGRRACSSKIKSSEGKRSESKRSAKQPASKKGVLSADQHFDALATPFASNIYGSYKGRLRLALLRDDLLPELVAGQSLLDVGAGIAQLSAEGRHLGLDAYALDAAAEMQSQAETYATDQYNQPWQDRYQVLPMQSYTLPTSHAEGFDWVWCHAVLAWLQDPADALQRLVGWVRPGGRLSLLFYNRDSMALQQIFRGRYGYLEKLWARMEAPALAAGDAIIEDQYDAKQNPISDSDSLQSPQLQPVKPFYPGGLTPQTPLDLQWVTDTLQSLGMRVTLQRGVRCFADYMQAEVRARMTEAQLLEVERTYRARMPYLAMGRYIHLIAVKTF